MAVMFLIVGLIVGGLGVAFYARPRLHALREQIERERTGADERVALVQQLNASWEERFRDMSAAALAQNNDSFLTLAETKLSPLTTTLSKFEQQTQALERSRQDAYSRLSNQVGSLASLQEQLRAETRSLATALRAPSRRLPTVAKWSAIVASRSYSSRPSSLTERALSATFSSRQPMAIARRSVISVVGLARTTRALAWTSSSAGSCSSAAR